jgi:hypothetical protein
MHTRFIAGIAVALLFWAVLSAKQETRTTPGFGTGVVTVRGTVGIENTPDVRAIQGGEWRVAIANVPVVAVSGTAFARRSGRYDITWPSGEHETVVIVEVGQSGWVQVDDRTGRRRWVNLAVARSVSELG